MKYLLISLLLFVVCIGINSSAKATSLTASGITISPAIEQISLSPSQNSANFSIQITNNTKQPVIINISARDFTSLNQYGGIGFLTGNQSMLANGHGLANDLNIGLTQLALAASQSQNVPIIINNANSLAAGGHYTAINYNIHGPASKKANSVTINQSLSTLVFLSTSGQGTQTTTLSTPVISRFAATFPKTVSLVFSNSGNTQTVPRGVVQIYKKPTSIISQATINIDSGLILPSSSRLFNLKLTNMSSGHLWPGIYHLKVYYRHDGQTGYYIYQRSFLYLSSGLLIAISSLIILAVILLITIRKKPKPVKSPKIVKINIKTD